MGKKRRHEAVELYDHSTYRNQATASVVEFDYRSRQLRLQSRTVNVTPRDPSPPVAQEYPPVDGVQEIRDDDVGVIVRAKTRAKQYINSVSTVPY